MKSAMKQAVREAKKYPKIRDYAKKSIGSYIDLRNSDVNETSSEESSSPPPPGVSLHFGRTPGSIPPPPSSDFGSEASDPSNRRPKLSTSPRPPAPASSTDGRTAASSKQSGSSARAENSPHPMIMESPNSAAYWENMIDEEL